MEYVSSYETQGSVFRVSGGQKHELDIKLVE